MGKFSDLPYFLLDEYFTESTSTGASNPNIQGSYLHGGRASTVVDGGYWEKMWVNVESIDGETPEYPGLVQYKFKPQSTIIEGDYFNFDLGSLLTLPASANGTFESGSEVYFKKGSYIYEWLTKHSAYKDFFNTNKMWLYFGKIYSHTGSETSYRIIFDGMKNFVMNALPLHQRTDNLTEFMKIYFDRIHSEIYNMTKNISSLLDAREIDTNWIEYLASIYNMDVDINLTGIELREWVENLVHLLKRKGTYTSLYIIWKSLLGGTSNDLNIYNRWHDKDLYGTYGTYIPLEYFYDVLHQMSYGYEPTGCSGSNWYQKVFSNLATNDIYEQTSIALTWDVRHEMFTRNMVVQCYDNDYNRIWPDTIQAVNNGLLRVTFSTSRSGYVFLESGEDYLHSQNDGSIEWIIAHDQGDKEVISQYQSLLYNMMMPDNISLSDDSTDVDFASAEDGYGIILSDGVVAVLQSTPASAWSMTHNLDQRNVIVQTFDMDDNMIQADNIYLDNENNCTATWSTSVSGYAVIKSVDQQGTLPDWTDKILSPHYKVEVDLSCEPLDGDADTPAILSEDTIDKLVEKWELMRPVSRFSHYHELISPLADFTGTYMSLYSASDAFLFTRYCASASEFLPSPSADTMHYNQTSHSNIWTISHDFDTANLIVQCYDTDKRRIWPDDIKISTYGEINIEFNTAINGTVSILVVGASGYIHNQIPYASTWTVNHSLSLKEVISQYDMSLSSLIYNVHVPSGVILDDSNTLTATWASNERGLGLISPSEVIWAETTEKTIWYIDHRLGSDSVVSLFFDDNDRRIEPSTVTLSSKNRIIATFPNVQSGYAVIKAVDRAFTESDIIDNIIDGGYWMLGQGTSGSNYDPVANNNVESMLVSGSNFDNDSDDDFYYLDFEVKSQSEDWNITEIAWFDKYNKIRFYTYCSPIHKPKDVWFNSHYRIIKSQT